MATQTGIGFSTSTSSTTAIQDAAKQALSQLGTAKPTFAFLISTPKHSAAELMAGLKAVIGSDVPVVGGPSIGVITQDHLSYAGYEVGVALVSSDSVQFDIFNQVGLGSGGEFETGQKLGQALLKSDLTQSKAMLLFYDSARGTPQIPLNLATPIIEGLSSQVEQFPPTAGIGFLGSNQFTPQQTWVGHSLSQQNVFAVSAKGSVTMDIHIFHGCRPSSAYHEITAVDGAVILEIDHVPALDRVTQLLGGAIDPATLPLRLLLGVNHGDLYGDYDPKLYATRLCMALDVERKGLVMFETDLKVGDQIQIMKRSSDMAYMKTESEAFLASLKGKKPFLALYADCLGRAAALCGDEEEEAKYIQDALRGKIPLLGFYSGVEIGPVGGKIRALDWTGVLCVLSEVG